MNGSSKNKLRVSSTYRLENISDFKRKLLTWGNTFKECVWLDSNSYETKYNTYDAVLAVGGESVLKSDFHNAFSSLETFLEQTKDWVFGYLGYDLKNDVEDLTSSNFDGLCFPDIYFFQPKKLIFLKNGEAEFCYLKSLRKEIEPDFETILNVEPQAVRLSAIEAPSEHESPSIKARIPKQDYLVKIDELLQHLHRGDIYEANFCQEFFAENVSIDPLGAFLKLNEISVPPFAAFLKFEGFHALSASPERYLKRSGNKIISQPIKGTAPRSKHKTEDLFLAENLKKDPKEISENIMIVDLVRNDLSRTATKASVKVEELCEVYSFNQVHQLVSTVVSEVAPQTSSVEVLKTTFPMGSMTGAPKISAMKIIEKLEESKRGLYSGAIGYFSPEGDFDFNVVIRSILYNQKNNYLSFTVGGAITAKSNPKKEYRECLLKAKAMREALQG